MDPDLAEPGHRWQALVKSTVQMILQLWGRHHLLQLRRPAQANKANGFYPRCLDTPSGTILNLPVAPLRHGCLPQL